MISWKSLVSLYLQRGPKGDALDVLRLGRYAQRELRNRAPADDLERRQNGFAEVLFVVPPQLLQRVKLGRPIGEEEILYGPFGVKDAEHVDRRQLAVVRARDALLFEAKRSAVGGVVVEVEVGDRLGRAAAVVVVVTALLHQPSLARAEKLHGFGYKVLQFNFDK